MIKGFKNRIRLFNQDPTSETKNLFVDEKNGFQIKLQLDKPPPDLLREQEHVLLDRLNAGSRNKKTSSKDVKIENCKNLKQLETKVDGNDVKADRSDVKTDRSDVTANGSDVKVNGNDVKADGNDVTGGQIAVQVDVEPIPLNTDDDADSITNRNIHPDEKPDQAGQGSSTDHLQVSDQPHHFFPKLNYAESESNNSSEAADKITPIADVAVDAARIVSGNQGSGFCKDPPRRCQSQRENRIVNPRLRKLSVPTTVGELRLQGQRLRTTSSPLPGETHREMMERHAISQQERQRRSSYYVATSTSIERMNSNDEYRRRRQSSASSSGASSRRSSVIDGRFRHESLTVESGDNDRGEKQRNDFYLNLPLLL